jgi:transposase
MTSGRRRYPTDLTDAEWQLLAPLIPAPKPGGRPPIHDRRELVNAMAYWVRAGCAWRLLPHDLPPWQTVYHYFRSWRQQELWSRSTGCFMCRSGSGKAERRRRARPSWTARASRPPTGGAARLRRRQEGQRPQAPPAGRHPRAHLQGPGDRGRHRRPRRRRPAAQEPGSAPVPPGCGTAGPMAATAAPSWTGHASAAASPSKWCSAKTADGSGAGYRPTPRRRSCPDSPWPRAGGWSGPSPGSGATAGSARTTNTSPPPLRRSSTWP